LNALPEQAVILLVDDREDDILLVRRALSRANVPNPLFIVRDGEEALSYLDGTGKYSNRDEYPLPNLLLLDLKMPRANGFDVLKWIRAQSMLSSLRVVVLTSSERIPDINQAYELGANSFLTKPLNFTDFTNTIRVVLKYWLEQSKRPEIERPAITKSETV